MNLPGNHPALVCVPELLQVWKNLFDDWGNSWFVMADFVEEEVIPKAPHKYRPELTKVGAGIRTVGDDPLDLPDWSWEREVARVLSEDVNKHYKNSSMKIEMNLDVMTKFQWFRQESKVTLWMKQEDIVLVPRKSYLGKLVPFTHEIMHTCNDKTLAQWHPSKKWLRPGHVRMQYQRLSKTLPPFSNGQPWHCTLRTGYYVGRCDKCFQWYCSEPPTKEQIEVEFYDTGLKREAYRLSAKVEKALAPKVNEKFIPDNPQWFGKDWPDVSFKPTFTLDSLDDLGEE